MRGLDIPADLRYARTKEAGAMMKGIEELKMRADQARSLYRCGHITRREAEEDIRPYAEAFNTKSKEIAKKYGQRARLFSITSYLR